MNLTTLFEKVGSRKFVLFVLLVPIVVFDDFFQLSPEQLDALQVLFGSYMGGNALSKLAMLRPKEGE